MHYPDGQRIASDRYFYAYLLDTGKVAVVPDSAFGTSPVRPDLIYFFSRRS